MDLHEGNYRELTIPNQRPDRETGKRRDLVAAVPGNLRTEGYLSWCVWLSVCFERGTSREWLAGGPGRETLEVI
jgi:hypothetical protein